MKAHAPSEVPQAIKWLAFAGWVVLPVVLTWAAHAFAGLPFLWTGPVWTVLAAVYMAVYFRWVKRRGTTA